MQSVCVILFLVGIAFSTGSAFAEEATFHGDGSTVFALKNQGVRLQKETVVIRYSSDKPYDSLSLPSASWNADVTAVFFNPANKNVEVTMGLPNWRSFAEIDNGDGQWAISELNVEADTEQGKIKHEEFKIARGQRPPNLPGNSPLFYDGGYRWTLRIPAKKSVSVTTRYSFGGFLSGGAVESLSDPDSVFHLPTTDLFWKNSPAKVGGWKFEDSRYRTVAYLVTPGKTWSGKIGATDVSIQLPPNLLPHLMVPQPAGFSVRDGFVHWRFENWEPRRPISVVQLIPQVAKGKAAGCPIFDSVEQATAWIKFAKKNHFDRESILTVKHTVAAKHGFRFAEPKWQNYFKSFAWYQPKSGVKLDEIPDEDKKILSLLETFEKGVAE